MRHPRIVLFLSAALIVMAAVSPSVAAQLTSRRAIPPGSNLPGRLGATTEEQPLVPALAAWNVPALIPCVNLYSGGLVLRYSAVDVPALGFDWDLSFFYNSTRSAEVGPLGHGWHHTYETSLLVNSPPGSMTVQWGDGRRDVFTPSGGGWIGPAPLQGRSIVAITGGYRLSTKHGDRFEFNSTGQLIRLIDRNANTMTLSYASGRLAQIADPFGRQIEFTYNGSGRLTTITSAVGPLLVHPLQLGYLADKLVSISQTAGYPFTFGYDASNRLTRITDAKARSTHVGYYGALAAVQWVRASCARREFFFDQTTRNTVVRDSVSVTENTETSYVFNVDGTTASVMHADLGIATSAYDPSTLQLSSHTDPNNHTWSSTYNAVGDRLTLTSPLSETWTWTYDPTFHLPETLTEPGGPLWQWTRDGNGNATTVTDPNNNPWTAIYDGQGLIQSTTDPNLNTTSYAYDASGECSSIIDPATYGEQFFNDPRGNLVSYVDQQSNSWTLTRDDRDHVTAIIVPAAGTWTLEWWEDGKSKNKADPEGSKTQYVYDALDRLIEVDRSGLGAVIIPRDGKGDEKGATDSKGSQTEKKTDGAGRPTEEKDPEGGTTKYEYDGLDRTIRTLPDGNQISQSWDERHRLTAWACGSDSSAYEYDAMSRLVRARRVNPPAPPIEYGFTYDPAGQLTQKETIHLGRTLTEVLDPGGRLTQMQDNLQPTPWDYGFDGRDLITSFAAQFDVQMNMMHGSRREPTSTSITPPNAYISEAFDAAGRLSSLNLSSSFASAYWYPTWSPRGDLIGYSSYSPCAGYVTMSATYDSAGSVLTEDHNPLASFAYTYDAVGNRSSKNGPDGPESYTHDDAHRLLSAGSIAQTWNVNGDVLTSGWPGHPISYTYRPDRSLATVVDSGSTWQFIPGPFGEIAATVSPAGDTTWYDSDLGPAGLMRRSTFAARASAPTAEDGYIPTSSGRTPLFRKLPGSVQALLPGPVGIAQVVDNSGLVTCRYYSMFGELLATQGVPSATPGFANMDVLREPNGPLVKGESDHGPPGSVGGDLVYLPRVASYARDLGFGPDFLSVGLNIDRPQDPPPQEDPMKVLEESARRFHEEGQKLRGLPGGGHFYDPDWRPPPGAGGCYFPVYEPIDWGVLGMPGAVLRADPIITILPTPIPTPTPTPGRPFKYGEEY